MKLLSTIIIILMTVPTLTSQGQFLLKNINTSWYPAINFGSNPEELIVFNNLMFFTADDGATGRQLWVTDGTTIGTQVFSSTELNVAGLTILNNYLYFSAEDMSGDRELYRTTGVIGTSPLKIELNASGNTNPSKFGYDAGRIYFKGTTSAGTIHVCSFPENAPSNITAHVLTGGGSLPYNDIIITGGYIYMDRHGSGGARTIYSMPTGLSTSVVTNHGSKTNYFIEPLIAYNNKVYLAAYTTLGDGADLYSVDATGFTLEHAKIQPKSFVLANGELYFSGTAVGSPFNIPQFLHRIDNSGTLSSFPSIQLVRSPFTFRKTLFVYDNIMFGWLEDGASNGIYQFHFNSPSTPGFSSNLPSKPVNFEDSVYLNGAWFHSARVTGVGGRVFRTDFQGTKVMCTANIDFTPSHLTLYNNDLYFTDVFWDTGNPHPQYHCDPPLVNTGVELFKLTNSQIECQTLTNLNGTNIPDGIYYSGTVMNINLTMSGDRCVIGESPTINFGSTTTVSVPAQIIAKPGGCP